MPWLKMALCFPVKLRHDRRPYRIIDTRFAEAFTVMCRTAARDRWIFSVRQNHTILLNVSSMALSVSAVFSAVFTKHTRADETGISGVPLRLSWCQQAQSKAEIIYVHRTAYTSTVQT